jgi:hypothetical protein
MLEQWRCAQHRMRTVRRRIYAAHLTTCRGIIEQLEQVEIDASPTAFVTRVLTNFRFSAYFGLFTFPMIFISQYSLAAALGSAQFLLATRNDGVKG